MKELTRFADIVENMAKQDFRKMPNFLFMDALTTDLIERGISYVQATKIVCNMEVDLKSFDKENPDWIRIVSSYGSMVMQLINIYGIVSATEMSRRLSINYS